MTKGEKIKYLREKKGLTQDGLAKYLNTTKQTINKYENGTITNIPSDKIEIIAKVLNCSPSYLMGWQEVNKDNLDEGISLYNSLDDIDKAEIRGEMRQMLKADKYRTKEALA